MTLAVVAGLAVVTALCKGLAALLPRVPSGLDRRTGGLAPALLAALVVTELGGADGVPGPDAKLAAVAVAVVLAWRRAPFAACVLAAAATAALLRL